ncbi:hypothetical protein DPEC_G00059750 [Dallia pectoralis]|uniref:Uncharacterized protein n=1 Tax=Dallia pectoralis TaxID=75939 RepID=A0ACC2H6L8_DALPE|nr:hypothetical protein DPEC_G00059750 [Dallia pectoralis]
MTSPFRLGFLYDPGISHFPHQTSSCNTCEQTVPPPLSFRPATQQPSATPIHCASPRTRHIQHSRKPPSEFPNGFHRKARQVQLPS